MSTVCATRSRVKPACLPPTSPGLIVYLVTSAEHLLGHGLRLAPLLKKTLAGYGEHEHLTLWQESGDGPCQLLAVVRPDAQGAPVVTWL